MRILAVEAHPDDVELLCAGTLARLTGLGHEVDILSVTAGELGTMGDSLETSIRTRLDEATASAAVIGARFHYVGLRDKHVFFNDENQNRITEIFRRLDPQLLFLPSPRDYNLDHEFSSLLARGAATAASMRLFSTEQWEAAPPTEDVPYLYYCDPIGRADILGRPVPATTYVDITPTLDTKLRMYNCFASQVEWLRHRFKDDLEQTVREWAAEAGRRAGLAHAEGFRQHVAPPFPKDNILVELLGARTIAEE